MGRPAERYTPEALRRLVAQARETERAFVASLTEAQRAEEGSATAWTAKDHLIHCNFWRERGLLQLAAAARGETPEVIEDYLTENERVYAERHTHAWEAVLAEADRLFTEFDTRAQTLTEAEYSEAERYPWRKGQPLAQTLLGNFVEHPAGHYAQFYLERGEPARAEEQQRGVLAAFEGAFGQGVAYGSAVYNLACFHALNGQRERALDGLRAALALNPSLRVWSREDPDFAALRTDPDYQAIVAD